MPDEELYEEDFAESRPIRVRHWQQLEAYTERLAQAAADREVYPADFSSPECYEATMEPLRKLVAERIGYPPPGLFDQGGPARLERVAEDATATYYRCWIPVSEDLETYGMYFVPKGVSLPAPLVVAQHGGGGAPEAATFQGGANYHDMIRGAIAAGFVVFAPLQLFNTFCDREDSPYPEKVRIRVDTRLRLTGTTLTALAVAKISRALDTVLQFPEVQADRVGMIGISYGGYFTLYTTALEPRIKCALGSCFFSDPCTWLAKEEPENWADIRFLGMLSDFDLPELAALVCPRPLQVQVGISDELFPIEGARKSAARAAEYYQRLGLEERFEFVDFEGGHEWYGASAWPFLKKWL